MTTPAIAETFVSPEILARLATLSRADVDALSYGAVKVDDEGTVLLYNRYESELAKVDPADAEGQNFFTELAPCTNNRLFFGKFKDGVAVGALDYTFTYRMRPTLVRVAMRRVGPDTNWIFVKKA